VQIKGDVKNGILLNLTSLTPPGSDALPNSV
jgi:hypothetical protein